MTTDRKGYGRHAGRRALEAAERKEKHTYDGPPEPLTGQTWPAGWCTPCADRGRYHFESDCPS